MVGFAPSPTVLLVSADPHVVVLLETAQSMAPQFRLELCSDFAEVLPLLRQEDIALVVADVTHAVDVTAVKEMLWSVMHLDRPVRSLLLVDKCNETTCDEFKRAGATCCRPRAVTAQKLAHALETLTFEARSLGWRSPEPQLPEQENPEPDSSFYISQQLEEMMKKVRRVAPQDTTLLLTGETGTGKTHLARFIHHLSARDKDSFKIVECSSLSRMLIESQLFGHVRGAFSGADRNSPGKLAAAGKGTLVLDEINSLPLDLQSKLLRAVEERVFEPVGSNETQPLQARLIAVSNVPLEEEVAAGRFRRDLYYRLDVVRFRLPSLRECTSAIAPLAQRFLDHFATKHRRDMREITPLAMRALERFHWLGNVRELRSVIESAVSCAAGPQIDLEDLPPTMREQAAMSHERSTASQSDSVKEPHTFPMPSRAVSNDLTLMETKAKAEVLRITEALNKHRNNRLRAAAELGISRMSLYKKLHKYGLYHSA